MEPGSAPHVPLMILKGGREEGRAEEEESGDKVPVGWPMVKEPERSRGDGAPSLLTRDGDEVIGQTSCSTNYDW